MPPETACATWSVRRPIRNVSENQACSGYTRQCPEPHCSTRSSSPPSSRCALVRVGAQALYLHTGDADLALAEYTVDADFGISPRELADTRLSIAFARTANRVEASLPLVTDRDELGGSPDVDRLSGGSHRVRSVRCGREYETPIVGVSDPTETASAVSVSHFEHVTDLQVVGCDESTVRHIDGPDNAHPPAWRAGLGPDVRDRRDVESPRRVENAAIGAKADERGRDRHRQNQRG